MKDYLGIFIIFLCIVSIFVAGCTSETAETVPTATPTTSIPTTVVPTTLITPELTEIPTITPNATTSPSVLPTLSPKADPTDLSEITFSHYSDSDFSLDYPSTWNITKSTFTLYNCNSVEANRCYQNETKTIGPFFFNEDPSLKKVVRIVTFSSADGNQKITAFTSDFLDNLNGNFILNPDLKWTQYQVTTNYPDIGATAIGNYKYAKSGNTMYSIFTMTAPPGSVEYPLAYTKKTFVTMHHIYEFTLISDNENIQKYLKPE